MQGPTVSPVFCQRDGTVTVDYFAIVICVPKKALYKSVQELRDVRLFSLQLVMHTLCLLLIDIQMAFSMFPFGFC